MGQTLRAEGVEMRDEDLASRPPTRHEHINHVGKYHFPSQMKGQPYGLLKDSGKKGLRLRVTKAGGKHWQFESRLALFGILCSERSSLEPEGVLRDAWCGIPF